MYITIPLAHQQLPLYYSKFQNGTLRETNAKGWASFLVVVGAYFSYTPSTFFFFFLPHRSQTISCIVPIEAYNNWSPR